MAITNESRIAGTTHTPVYSAYGFTSSGGQVQATWSLGGTPRSGPGVKDMNAAGQVVGSIGGEPSRAFLWENGVLRELGNPFGGEAGETWSVATAINGRAQVVGTAAVGSGFGARAFLWENGVFVDIGTLGGSTSNAEDINANGDVVGSAETAAGASHAFVWRAGTMTDLGTLGGSSSRATAVNDVGQIVGQSQTASGVWHMFLWHNGVMTDLGARGNATVPSDINNGGQIVGSIGEGSQWLPFVWEAGTFWGLPKLEPASPADAYNADSAVAINDAGQIVGSSQQHAVRWG